MTLKEIIDKRKDTEARELYTEYIEWSVGPSGGAWPEWDDLKSCWKTVWTHLAVRARELADERYKPLVDAALVYMETHGQAEREDLRRELDNLKGGG